jgi:hypothetical protein
VVVFGEPITFNKGESAQEMLDKFQSGMDKTQAEADKFLGA